MGPQEESPLPSQQGACLLGLGPGCGHRWWSHWEPPLTGQEVTDRPEPPSLCLWDQPFLGGALSGLASRLVREHCAGCRQREAQGLLPFGAHSLPVGPSLWEGCSPTPPAQVSSLLTSVASRVPASTTGMCPMRLRAFRSQCMRHPHPWVSPSWYKAGSQDSSTSLKSEPPGWGSPKQPLSTGTAPSAPHSLLGGCGQRTH